MKDTRDTTGKSKVSQASIESTTKKLPHDHGHGSNENQLQEHMPKQWEFAYIANIYKQMDDEKRIKIFWILCHVEECVANLAAMMDMSSPAVSHHLSKLKSAGLIVSKRNGKEVYYRAAETKEAELLHRMIEALVDISCPVNMEHE